MLHKMENGILDHGFQLWWLSTIGLKEAVPLSRCLSNGFILALFQPHLPEGFEDGIILFGIRAAHDNAHLGQLHHVRPLGGLRLREKSLVVYTDVHSARQVGSLELLELPLFISPKNGEDTLISPVDADDFNGVLIHTGPSLSVTFLDGRDRPVCFLSKKS